MPPDAIAVQLDFPSHLKAQRLTEELEAAQKKLKQYEELFTTLYHNACEHCKESFQRIGVASAGPVSVSRLAAVKVSSAFDSNGSSSLSTKPLWNRILKRARIPLPRLVYGPTAPSVSVPEPGGASESRHGISTEQIQTFAGATDPFVLASPENKPIQAQYFVKYPDRTVGEPTLQVRLESVLTHEAIATSIKFSPDGKYLAIGASDTRSGLQKTYIYNVTIGKKICLLANRYTGRHQPANYLAFSPEDGRYLATGHSTGQTMIWQVGKKHVRNAFGGEDTSVEFSPDGRFIASSSFTRGVRIWSMRDGSSILLQDHDGVSFPTAAVKFSPDGKHVVASDVYGMLRIWNVRTSKLVKQWEAHEDTALSVSFTPIGRGLVTASRDHRLKYWDLGPPSPGFGDLREIKAKFAGHMRDVYSTSISPDGRWVVSGSNDRSARIWDIVDGSLRCTLLGHECGVTSVDFSPTGDYMACASWNGKVSVWRYES